MVRWPIVWASIGVYNTVKRGINLATLLRTPSGRYNNCYEESRRPSMRWSASGSTSNSTLSGFNRESKSMY
jgi:hypothetical protein